MESVEWSGFCEWKKRKLIAIFRERYGRWDLGRTVTVRNTKLCPYIHTARQPVQRHCYCPLRMHTPYLTPYETRSMRELEKDFVCASKKK